MKKFTVVFFLILITLSIFSAQASALLSLEDETGITYAEDPSCITKIAPTEPMTQTEPMPENPIKKAFNSTKVKLEAFSDAVEAYELLWAIAPAAVTAILAMILLKFHKSLFVLISSILLVFGYLSVSLIQRMFVPLIIGVCLSIVVSVIFIIASKNAKKKPESKL